MVQSWKKSRIGGGGASWGPPLAASHGHLHHAALLLLRPSKAPLSQEWCQEPCSQLPALAQGSPSFSRRPPLAGNSKLGQTRNEGRSHRQQKAPEEPALNPSWVLVKQRLLCVRRAIVLRLGASVLHHPPPFFFLPKFHTNVTSHFSAFGDIK